MSRLTHIARRMSDAALVAVILLAAANVLNWASR